MNAVNRGEVVAALDAAMQRENQRARDAFEALQRSLEGEAKSTAGDKHETGRAMVQLEMEQAVARMARLESMTRQWHALDPNLGRTSIRPGAVVLTAAGGFVIGVAWGAFSGPSEVVWRGISSDAPLALALMGKEAGSEVTFREKNWQILDVA